MTQQKISETPIFSDIFWSTNILDFVNNKNLIDLAYETKQKDKGIKISNSLGYHSSYFDVTDNADYRLKELLNEIIDLVKNIIEEKIYKEPKNKLFSIDAWVNINSKYSYNKQHIHGGDVVLSVVYYAKVPKDSGTFYFKCPSSRMDKISYLGIDRDNFFATHREKLPEEGDVIVFPGWMEHGVNQSMSDEDRISYAFNCRVKHEPRQS